MSASGEYYGGKEKTSMLYQREGDEVTVSLRGMTNYEIRDIIVGLWARLEQDDQFDHIRALSHYVSDPDAVLPMLSRAIRDAKDIGRH